jgi:hypothetical protein
MTLQRQRGAIRLRAVVLGSVLLAALAMALLFSLRTERNLFAEFAGKAGKMAADNGVLNAAAGAIKGSEGQMRKCVIDGKTVVSNAVCSETNKTTRVIKIQDSRGFEAPKAPVQAAPEPTSDKMTDKMIEKQLQ